MHSSSLTRLCVYFMLYISSVLVCCSHLSCHRLKLIKFVLMNRLSYCCWYQLTQWPRCIRCIRKLFVSVSNATISLVISNFLTSWSSNLKSLTIVTLIFGISCSVSSKSIEAETFESFFFCFYSLFLLKPPLLNAELKISTCLSKVDNSSFCRDSDKASWFIWFSSYPLLNTRGTSTSIFAKSLER